MKEAAKNAMRSGLVVIGALAFGYLSLNLGFKPYLERAQLYADNANSATAPVDNKSDSDTFDDTAHILTDDDGVSLSNRDS